MCIVSKNIVCYLLFFIYYKLWSKFRFFFIIVYELINLCKYFWSDKFNVSVDWWIFSIWFLINSN